MHARRYLALLALGTLAWAVLFFGFTLLVDPYGVSPLKVPFTKLNAYKPRRVDIDRVIKPYEVWRHQPKTVFLGTSRIHQSIDPAALDGTRFAPAYNASIPASSLGLNISHLQQYLDLDPQLRTVVVELFLYNFLGQGQEHPPKDFQEYLRNSLNLFISADTLWAAVQTVGYNLTRTRPAFEISPRGNYSYPPGHNAKPPFDGYAAGIWKYHATRAKGMVLHEPAFDAVRALIDLARSRNVEILFVLSPNHAYDDYYIEAIGAWGTVQEWIARLAGMGATVYSFSQPNDWVYEPVSERMRYWHDPYHFSLEMGRGIQQVLAGRPGSDLPANFAMRLTPGDVPAHVAGRSAAVRAWAAANPGFVTAFHEEKRRFERGQAPAESDRVEATLKGLDELQAGVGRLFPPAAIGEYRVVSDAVMTAKAVPAGFLQGAHMENAWGGRVVTQVFPAKAWGPRSPATYNFILEGVPRADCARLVASLGSGRPKTFRINVEPSGRVHERFPAAGDLGCVEGANSIGLTLTAD